MSEIKEQHLPDQADVQPAPKEYQPPRLEALGNWQAITLIGSIGFNSLPGLPGGQPSDY